MADLIYPTNSIQEIDGDTTIARRSALTIQHSASQAGGILISDTDLHAGPTGLWKVVYVISDAKFKVFDGNVTNVANTSSGSATVIPSTIKITGKFENIQLHSGAVIAYN